MRTLGKARALGAPKPATGRNYERLFQVEITHSFYTQQLGRCPDFRVIPTDATAQLLASLGLLFKDESAGFSVFFRPADLDNIVAEIRRQAAAPDRADGFWSRMTFLFELIGPQFVGVTALPIDTRPAAENLYTSNCAAHYPPDAGETVALLCQGEFLDGAALRPTVNAGLELTVPMTVECVEVRDISGEPVLRWTPKLGQKRVVPPPPGAKSPRLLRSAPPAVPMQRVALDLGELPHDLYTIALYDAEGAPLGAPLYPRELLYVPTASDAMVLLDMLFTQPTAATDGVYPIPPLFDGRPRGRCGGIAYRLPFEARNTYWHYYVVSQLPNAQFTNLEITGGDAAFTADPDPVRLPSGADAIRFTTDTLLPLREKSAQRFQLTGTRRDAAGQDNPILVAPLPVAPGAPVWPGPADQSETGTSEMFVHV